MTHAEDPRSPDPNRVGAPVRRWDDPGGPASERSWLHQAGDVNPARGAPGDRRGSSPRPATVGIRATDAR